MKPFRHLIAALCAFSLIPILTCSAADNSADTVYTSAAYADAPKIVSLTCEYRVNPTGVTSTTPKLSWKFSSTARNVTQSAYQVLVSGDQASLKKDKGAVWDSRKILSDASIQVSYAGKPLQAGKAYYYKVRVWDNNGRASAWSTVAFWQMGLMTTADWKAARWIGYEELPAAEKVVPAIHMRSDLPEKNDVLPLLRKQFNVARTVKKATAFVSGLGHFELSMNGVKVGDHFLDPGWTEYDKEALYVTFDVTKNLKKGGNALGVVLGNGFYFIPRDKRYRKITGAYGYPKMICRLLIEYSDGSEENVISDESWKAAPSPITYTSIYGGEDYNATLEQKGWDTFGFDDVKWKNAVVVKAISALSSQMAEPLKVFENFSPVKITQVKPGVWVYDMGQNASAIPAISVKGAAGTVVKIAPAELLNNGQPIGQWRPALL